MGLFFNRSMTAASFSANATSCPQPTSTEVFPVTTVTELTERSRIFVTFKDPLSRLIKTEVLAATTIMYCPDFTVVGSIVEINPSPESNTTLPVLLPVMSEFPVNRTSQVAVVSIGRVPAVSLAAGEI